MAPLVNARPMEDITHKGVQTWYLPKTRSESGSREPPSCGTRVVEKPLNPRRVAVGPAILEI